MSLYDHQRAAQAIVCIQNKFNFIVLGCAQNTILEAAEESHKQAKPNYHCCHHFPFVKLYKNQSLCHRNHITIPSKDGSRKT